MAEVVEALLKQEVTPDHIILWLQDSSNDQLPKAQISGLSGPSFAVLSWFWRALAFVPSVLPYTLACWGLRSLGATKLPEAQVSGLLRPLFAVLSGFWCAVAFLPLVLLCTLALLACCMVWRPPSLLLSHQIASSSTAGNSGNHHMAVSRLQHFPIGAVKYVSPRKAVSFCQPLFGAGSQGSGGRLNFSAVAATPAWMSLQAPSHVSNKSFSAGAHESSAAAYDLDQLLQQETCETSMSKSQQAYPKPPKMVSPHERATKEPTANATDNHGAGNTDTFPWAQQALQQSSNDGHNNFTPLATKSSRTVTRLSTATPRLTASTPKNSAVSSSVGGRRSVGEELVAAATPYDSRPANWNRRLSAEPFLGAAGAGETHENSRVAGQHSHNSNHHNSFSSKFPYDVKPSEHRNSLSDYVVFNNSINKKSANRKKNNPSTSNLSNCANGSFLQNSSTNQSWDNQNRISLDISDSDTFPPMSSSSSSKTDKNQKKRRIKPTRVTPTRAHSGGDVNSAFAEVEQQQTFAVKQPLFHIEENSVFLETRDSSDTGLGLERKMLCQLRAKMKTTTAAINSMNDSSASGLLESNDAPVRSSKSLTGMTSVKESLISQENNQDNFLCSPELVSNEDTLNDLSRVYADLVLYNYVPSLMMELYFAFQLLTARGCLTIAPPSHSGDVGTSGLPDKAQHPQTYFFGSLANCVYFASRFLSLVNPILQLLDRSLLRLLVENKRLQIFAPQLQQRLLAVVGASPAQPSPKQPPRSPIKGVAYQLDTDNRTNFPDNTTFHIFRKQRDIFYELLRQWEREHQSPDWNLSCSLGHKIRSLLDLGPDPANVAHLARLFASQLITMCETGHMAPWKPQEGGTSGVLSLLQRQHPEKFERLQQRLVAPSRSTGGPVPPPSFPGVQQFFRGFLLEAYNPTFNAHLEDNFVAKLLDLLGASENDEAPSARRRSRSSVSLLLRRVGVLSKFLGVLWFSAYISPLPLPQPALAQQVALRSKLYPRLSLCAMLRSCAARGQLVTGVVCCVQLLSVSDAAALHTTHLQTVVFVLIQIYKMALCSGQFSKSCCHRGRGLVKRDTNEDRSHGKRHFQRRRCANQTHSGLHSDHRDCSSPPQSCVEHHLPVAVTTECNLPVATDGERSKSECTVPFIKRPRTLNFTEDDDKRFIPSDESDCGIVRNISVVSCSITSKKDNLTEPEDLTDCFNKISSKKLTKDYGCTRNVSKSHVGKCKKSHPAGADVYPGCRRPDCSPDPAPPRCNCQKSLVCEHQHNAPRKQRLHSTSLVSSLTSGNVTVHAGEADVMLLHENVNQRSKIEVSKTVLSEEVSLFLRLLLGWLFDLPVFPDGLFHADPYQAEIDIDEYVKTTELLGAFYSNPWLISYQNTSKPQSSWARSTQTLASFAAGEAPSCGRRARGVVLGGSARSEGASYPNPPLERQLAAASFRRARNLYKAFWFSLPYSTTGFQGRNISSRPLPSSVRSALDEEEEVKKNSQDDEYSDEHSAPFNDASLATVRSLDNVCPPIQTPANDLASSLHTHPKPSFKTPSKIGFITPLKVFKTPPVSSRVTESVAYFKTPSSFNPPVCQTPQRIRRKDNALEHSPVVASTNSKPSAGETPCKQAMVTNSTVAPGKELLSSISPSPYRNTCHFKPDSRSHQFCSRRNETTCGNKQKELSNVAKSLECASAVACRCCVYDDDRPQSCQQSDSLSCSGTSSCPCCCDSSLAASCHSQDVMNSHSEGDESCSSAPSCSFCDLSNNGGGFSSLNSTPFKTPVVEREFQKHNVIYEGLGTISPMVSITFQDTPDHRRGGALDDVLVPPPASPPIPSNKLDEYMIVDHQLMQEWCPQLSELKALLLAYNVGGGMDGGAPTAGVRKITPLSALPSAKTLPRQDKATPTTTNVSTTASLTAADSSRPCKQEEAAHRDIQHQLEESFFHQQPASVRETVQFVGEQLVTNCVRHLRCSHIPDAIASHTDQLQQTLEGDLLSVDANLTAQLTTEQVETVARARVLAATLSLRSQVKSTCLQHLQHQLDQLPQLLLMLLPTDMSEQGVDVCSGVVRRSCTTRVGAWLTGHLEQATPSSLLSPTAVKIVRTVLKKMNVNDTPDLHLSTSFEAASAVFSSSFSNSTSAAHTLLPLHQLKRCDDGQKYDWKSVPSRSPAVLDSVITKKSLGTDAAKTSIYVFKFDAKASLRQREDDAAKLTEQQGQPGVPHDTSGLELFKRDHFVSESAMQTSKISDVQAVLSRSAETKEKSAVLKTIESNAVRHLIVGGSCEKVTIFTSKAGGPQHVLAAPAPSVLMAEMKNMARAIHCSATTGSAPLLYSANTPTSGCATDEAKSDERPVVFSPKDGVFRERVVGVTPHPLTSSTLSALTEAAAECVKDRGDLTPPVLNGLKALSVDILVMICAVQPSLASEEVVSAFLRLWRVGAPLEAPPTLASTLVSPRILHLVEEAVKAGSLSPSKCCVGIQVLATRCVLEDLLQKEVLHEKAVALLQHCWSQDLLHGLSALVQSLCDAEDGNSVVSWLPWLCDEMENFPDMDD